jgi:hypothetical protein
MAVLDRNDVDALGASAKIDDMWKSAERLGPNAPMYDRIPVRIGLDGEKRFAQVRQELVAQPCSLFLVPIVCVGDLVASFQAQLQ